MPLSLTFQTSSVVSRSTIHIHWVWPLSLSRPRKWGSDVLGHGHCECSPRSSVALCFSRSTAVLRWKDRCRASVWLRKDRERWDPPSPHPAPGHGILASMVSLIHKMWNCEEAIANILISTGTETSLLESCEVLECYCLSSTHPSAACTRTQKGCTHKFT